MSICSPEYWLWLQSVLGAGARVDELLSFFGDPEQLYEAGSQEWKLSGLLTEKRIEALKAASLVDAAPILRECQSKGYTLITPDSELYPARFRELRDYPLVLFGLGDCTVLGDTVSIGIVGTRNASAYGIEIAQKLSFQLAKTGVTIISGAALGIDSEAHAGAMLAKGRTAAFLGCGLSFDYLRENASLRRAITRYGAIFSEYPPLSPASRTTFPVRNRLISGVTLGTVVIEAGVKSGSLITASRALEQGKDVFAVPGDIVRSSFGGTNLLIQQGAKPVFSAEDILYEYEYTYGELIDFSALLPLQEIPYVAYRHKTASSPSKAQKQAELPSTAEAKEAKPLPDGASENAKRLYKLFGGAPKAADELSEQSGLTVSETLCALTELELFGVLSETADGKYEIN